MRVVIADSDVKSGRKLAASVEQMLPKADVLLYTDPAEAIAGIVEHEPDVAFIGAQVGGTAGPELLAQAREASDDPKYVGIVATPDADASLRWVAAGAKLVVAQPVDRLAIRAALRSTAGGIDA